MKPSLPESISPCSNVRRSCSSLMNHKPCFIHTIQSIERTEEEGKNDVNHGQRSVLIDKEAMNQLSTKIAQSLLHKLQSSNTPSSSPLSSSSSSNQDNQHIVNECIENLNFASWDADGWHYTGTKYTRSNTTTCSTTTAIPTPFYSPKAIEQQRFERVALYVMVMDCINFCFWPVDDSDNKTCGDSSSSDISDEMINLLEYEHLAIALKCIAEGDDNVPISINDTNNEQPARYPTIKNESDDIFVQAEDSYALAPQNLIHLNEESFLEMILQHLPKTTSTTTAETTTTTNQIFSIPNAKERVRLIIEMAQSLLSFHNGSATCFIAQADKSADRLVHLILQYFPGFRDTTLCNCSSSSSNIVNTSTTWVAFYKRAQILVADLWAALGKNRSQQINNNEKVDANALMKETEISLDYCDFVDMDKITTFADYRVPQLLRHLGVLIYSPTLSQKVDSKIELQVFSLDELYIRAATVVAVDELVEMVKTKLQEGSNGSTMIMEFSQSVNAVKMDWYLWNIGEKLDRSQSLGDHHRVRTIFY